MNTQHTPGPWHTDGFVTKDLDIISPDGRIAMIDCDDCDADTLEANARLIAAAPDLLDALLSIAEHAREFADLEDSETMVARMTDKARAAIAKATGGAA
jgi:hypothetical protein